jgi:hypothetical protein
MAVNSAVFSDRHNDITHEAMYIQRGFLLFEVL